MWLQKFREYCLKIPILKQYCQFILWMQAKFLLWRILRSEVICQSPTEEFLISCQAENIYLYLPWIPALTNKLIQQINHSNQYQLIAFALFKGTEHIPQRREIDFFARHSPKHLNEIIKAWLTPVSTHIKGLILTFDYGLIQRAIIKVCRDLNIQTILIPHESVFLNRDKYYFHPLTNINNPLCDVALCWGELQKEIFVSRGYPENRVRLVGAPKLDNYFDFKPKLSRDEFCRAARLHCQHKMILFAAQTLDFQVQQCSALYQQRIIILQLIDYCQKQNCDLILRCPPTQFNILDGTIEKKMKAAGYFIDRAEGGYLFSTEEAIYHANIVVSINSTMLLEALLMGKPALSVKYFAFEDYWQDAKIPSAQTHADLVNILNRMLHSDEKVQLTHWAKRAFSPGEFDGKAAARIQAFLEQNMTQSILKLPNAQSRILQEEGPSADLILLPRHKNFAHLAQLIPAKKIISKKEAHLIGHADLAVQLTVPNKYYSAKTKRLIQHHHLPSLFVTEGLLKAHLPGLNIIIDDLAPYYETHSRFQLLLNSELKLTSAQEKYAIDCLQKILSYKLSAHFMHHHSIQKLGQSHHSKILLIDESKSSPLLTQESNHPPIFKTMLEDILKKHPDHDILIFRPKDIPLRQSSFQQIKLHSYLKKHKNIHILDPYYCSYDLFPLVEKVAVGTSTIGFEALLAGVPVACYGNPFYAHRGLTLDFNAPTIEKKGRSVLDIFYIAYIHLSRYYNLYSQQKCPLDEWILQQPHLNTPSQKALHEL